MASIDDLTPEQKKSVEELKRRIEADLTPTLRGDPTLFYRFLKARNFKVNDAESMLRKHLLWRKVYDIDNIITDFKIPEVLLKYAPVSFIAFDKDGAPVIYYPIGEVDGKGILKSVKPIDAIKFDIRNHECDLRLLESQNKKLGKCMYQYSYVYDCSKLTFAKATFKKGLDVFMAVIDMYQDNYPERLKMVYIINSSLYFTIAFAIIKTVIASSIFEKIKVFGSDGYQEVLSQVIDPDELPAFLGGNKTDPDGNPLCHTFINHGSLVPEEYFVTKSKQAMLRGTGVKKMTVSRFSTSEIKFEIEEPGTVLEWEIELESRDIGFGLLFVEKAPNVNRMIELLPKQKIDTYYEPESGLYKCEKPGSYIIIFDNTYSWIYSKEVYYRIRIVQPNGRVLPVVK